MLLGQTKTRRHIKSLKRIHFADVEGEVQFLLLRLAKQHAKREGVAEQLKAENPMEWVQKMNNIRNRAKEIINTNLIDI